MRTWMQLAAVLIGIVLFGSSCASLNYSSGDMTERINWREYNDC